jgi:hypothetical protein
MTSFRHVVLIRWAEGATEAQIEALVEGLGRLPGQIPQIRHYTFGRDAGINTGNHDFVIVAEFADVDDYLVYRDHPDHVALINDLLKPVLGSRAAVQYAL